MFGWLRRLIPAPAANLVADRPDVAAGASIPPELAGLFAGEGVTRRISRSEALKVPAVLRGRNLICGTLGALPHHFRDPSRNQLKTGWLLTGNIDPDLANSVLLTQTYEDLLFESVAWWQVTARRAQDGYPVHARYVPHSSVHVKPNASVRAPMPDRPDLHGGTVYIDGVAQRDIDVIRFDSPNPPLLVHAADAIRTALRLSRTVNMYAEDPLPLGWFELAENADPLSESEIQERLDAWAQARRKRAWGYVDGLKPNFAAWDPEKLQLATQLDKAVLEIARALGLDPEDLGVSVTSRTYQNGVQRRQDLIDFVLNTYAMAVIGRLSMHDVVPRNYQAIINYGAFLRADIKTRMETYEIGLRVGAYEGPEEIRELEDKPPARTRPPATQPVAAQEEPMKPPLKLVRGAQFSQDNDDDSVLRVSFSDSGAVETFRVNVEKRTISGIVVPWGKVARAGFAKWRFAEGSLHWSTAERVKLNTHHNFDQIVGRGIRLQSVAAGLDATFKIGRGPDGDQALQKAEDGLWDGFSVEVFFDENDDWQPDPTDESVRLVRSGTLRGVALTGMPAFDDARVTSVVASARKEGTMPQEGENGQGQPQTVALRAEDFNQYMTGLAEKIAESHKVATEGLAQNLGDSISAGIKAALENLSDPQSQDGPTPVRAARFQVTREEPVYRFDGSGPSLVRDAWYAQREHDTEAKDRLRKFHAQSQDVQALVKTHVAFQAAQTQHFATVTTSNVSQIIPPGYRPDLFVPQLTQGRPFVNSLSRGTISNATPFVVPVFGSAAGMTGTHTEGQAATEGTLGFGVKTVTPGAISGKLPLTREIVDSSNPAIDQIALSAMQEDYARQTEQRTYDLLNGSAAGQGGAVVGGFNPNGVQVYEPSADIEDGEDVSGGALLVKAIRRQLALYPFARFAAPDRGLLSKRATVALAAAEDKNGRPLLPSIGAQNTSGLGNAVQVGWFVDGLGYVPAWAITGASAGDADVFTINSADGWVWESPILAFRFEEKSGPQIIELALFGYFAVHLLRPVGLSAVRMNASDS